MSDSIFSRTSLLSFFMPGPRRNGIVSGKWGSIVEGSGWHDVEYDGAQPFRWAENGAQLELAPLDTTWISLDLDIEPGPSLGGSPLRLEICDETGACLAVVESVGRQVVHVVLPVDPVSRTVLTFQTAGKMTPIPGEPRRLCYRIFGISQSAPLLSPKMRFETGWYTYESVNGHTFRWASNGASIQVHAARANPVLSVDLEPGPGTDQRPFRIDLCRQGQERIFTTSIRTRQQIQMRLPMKLGEFGVFHFSGDESLVVQAPGDPRNLVFRTFGMTIG